MKNTSKTLTAHGLVKSSTTSFLRVTSARLATLVSLFLATILLAACGGGGSSGGGGGSSEKAPLVVAAVIAPAIGVVGSGRVDVAVTATKQDNSNTTAVTFPPTVAASGCTATLAGSGTSGQYSGATINSSVMVTYTVNSSVAVECGAFTFSATEDGAVGRGTLAAGTIRFDMDSDGDGIADAMDVDADGDGLIEINTAAELNMMRYNLAGTGLDDGTSDTDNTTGGNSDGCGGRRSGDANACNGYEQMMYLDLNDLPDNAIPDHNWEPVGGDTPFTGIFDGGGYIIRNLSINNSNMSNNCGGVNPNDTRQICLGLFGRVASPAIGNITISGININVVSVDTQIHAGGLIGLADGSISIEKVATTKVSILIIANNTMNVGGILGRASASTAEKMIINNSYSQVISLAAGSKGSRSRTQIGGLIGVISNADARISNSYSTITHLSSIAMGGADYGGLIGVSTTDSILYSYFNIASVNITNMLNSRDPSNNRTLAILKSCPGAGCQMNPYMAWSTDIWNFGGNTTLPSFNK